MGISRRNLRQILVCMVAVATLVATVGGAVADESDGWDFTHLAQVDPSGSESGDHYGRTLAVGDFNGDGYEDLAVGSPEEHTQDKHAGSVEIWYGGASGFVSHVYADQRICDKRRLNGDFSKQIGVGNFDGDDYDDLYIRYIKGWWVTQEESMAVVYGSEDGLDLTNLLGKRQCNEWVPSGNIVTADFNRDGHDDLATEIGGFEFAWSPGSPDGLDFDSWWPVIRTCDPKPPGLPRCLDLGAVTSGDFDNDSYPDIAVMWFLDAPTRDHEEGWVSVIYGAEGGFVASGPRTQTFNQADAGLGQYEGGDRFGESLAAGDFDGDGTDDLVIGTPLENVGDIVNAGVVGILYGGDNGLQLGKGQVFDQATAGLGEVERNDHFGQGLAVGDFVGDGTDDLAIGVPGEGILVNGSTVNAAGVIGALYGRQDPWRFASNGENLTDRDVPERVAPQDLVLWQGVVFDQADTGETIEGGDQFGSPMVAGDFNGDGIDELVIGVWLEDVGGAENAGIVTVGFPWPRPTCNSLPATIVGTPDGELLVGTAGDDVIVGLGGDDDIVGLGGNDTICGGPGDDAMNGSSGNDWMDGGGGNDAIFGAGGNDRVYGGPGSDSLVGGSGRDKIWGNAGADDLYGRRGNDRLRGGAGTDSADGGPGTDSCIAETVNACE